MARDHKEGEVPRNIHDDARKKRDAGGPRTAKQQYEANRKEQEKGALGGFASRQAYGEDYMQASGADRIGAERSRVEQRLGRPV